MPSNSASRPPSIDPAERLLLINAASVQSDGGRVVLDALMRAIARRSAPNWRVEVVVRNPGLLPPARHIFYFDLEDRWRGWMGRARLELRELKRMWRNRPVDTFLSMQGTNATIPARRKFVYCHNALGFAFPRLMDAIRSPRAACLQIAYAFAYRFGIGAQPVIIVQQEWQRTLFRERLALSKCLVAHPITDPEPRTARQDYLHATPLRMIYPASALPHKNIELLCQAVTLLASDTPDTFHLLLTLDGNENALARSLKARFGGVPEIDFAGKLSRASLQSAYDAAHLLVFPSLVESWGLPLTEAKQHGLGVLAADLPYARETLGNYDAADFFDPSDASALAARIRDAWSGKGSLRTVKAPAPSEPFAPDWEALVDRILDVN